ncbi:hypothetical protein MMC31_007701, partial [Peltigera leucophlebia]|nr:hypothetical protein [Peltigera leucophlebia]
MAIGAENLEEVQNLTRVNPAANLPRERFTPLQCSVWSSIEIMEALIDAGAVIKGSRALQTAAYKGNTKAISFLLSSGAPIDEAPDNGVGVCRIALGEAAPKGNLETVKLLIAQRDYNDVCRSALCEAAFEGNVKAVQLLTDKGADIDLKDGNGKSALELAEMKKHDACVDILRGRGLRAAMVRPQFCNNT